MVEKDVGTDHSKDDSSWHNLQEFSTLGPEKNDLEHLYTHI